MRQVGVLVLPGFRCADLIHIKQRKLREEIEKVVLLEPFSHKIKDVAEC